MNPLYVLDARQDPANPRPFMTPAGKALSAQAPGGSYVHGNLWPHGGTDRFLLVGSESTGSCNTTAESAGAFMTFEKMVDAETQAVTGFELRDRFRLGTGLPTEGNSPYDDYCAHWFSTHPDSRDGGLVAMGWYQHGTRFFNVLPDGKIKEVGWFLPLGAGTSAAYWVNEEIVYAVDYHRGIDILRVIG